MIAAERHAVLLVSRTMQGLLDEATASPPCTMASPEHGLAAAAVVVMTQNAVAAAPQASDPPHPPVLSPMIMRRTRGLAPRPPLEKAPQLAGIRRPTLLPAPRGVPCDVRAVGLPEPTQTM